MRVAGIIGLEVVATLIYVDAQPGDSLRLRVHRGRRRARISGKAPGRDGV